MVLDKHWATKNPMGQSEKSDIYKRWRGIGHHGERMEGVFSNKLWLREHLPRDNEGYASQKKSV